MGTCKSKESQYDQKHKDLVVSRLEPIHLGSILSILNIPNGIATCSDDKRIALSPINSNGKLSTPVAYLEGHKKSVNRAVYCNDNLWSVSRDLSIRQWNLTSNTCVSHLPDAHELNISSIVAQHDSKAIFSGSRDYRVKAWDVEKQCCVVEFSAPRNIVTAMEIDSCGGPLLYQCSEDLSIRVWDTRSQQKTPSMHITGYVYFPLCISLGKNGISLATGCKGFESVGCEVKLWDLRNTRQQVSDFKGHTHDVTGCQFSQNSERLVSVSKDGSMYVWNTLLGDDHTSTDSSEVESRARVASLRTLGKIFTGVAMVEPLEASYAGGANGALATMHVGAFDGSVTTVELRPQAADERAGGGGGLQQMELELREVATTCAYYAEDGAQDGKDASAV